MPAIWSGSVSFGLVNVAVRAHPATEEHSVRFHQVHAGDGGRIQIARMCSVCGLKPVDYLDVDRLYESPTGERVIVSDEDLARLPAAVKAEIEVLQFVPVGQVDQVLFEKSYFLEPAGPTPRAYVLLAEALVRTDRIAVVRWTLRQKTQLAALHVRAGVLVLQGLRWPDEIRRPLGVAARVSGLEPQPFELDAARALVDAMTEDFDPTGFVDDYQVQLKQMLDAMIAERAAPAISESGSGVVRDAVVDELVEALRRSVRSVTVDPDDRT